MQLPGYFFLLSLLVINIACYLEFKLIRVPNSPQVYSYGVNQCLSDLPKKERSSGSKNKRQLNSRVLSKDDEGSEEEDDQQSIEQIEDKKVMESDDFKQICYEKDISYSIELINDRKQRLLLSMDLTVPISWIKGQKCYISSTHKQCTRVQTNLKQQTGKIAKRIKDILKKSIFKKPSKKARNQNNNEYALIEGSSQVVKGVLEKTKTLQFSSRDSGRLTRLLDVIMLGLAMVGIDNTFKFQNTTFISATQISPSLNFLCDGAISLRFDENSESSFLKQIIARAQTEQSFVTIFIGRNNQSMTIGDLSVKNSAQGLSGVHWIPVQQNQLHGKLPITQSIEMSESNSDERKAVAVKLPVVLTLSSSSITIPEQQVNRIFEKFFKKSTCMVQPQTRYILCDKISAADVENKELNFVINSTDIMIPLKDLVLQSKRHTVLFNVKTSLDDRYIILGEPFFKHYFVVLDYQNNRIGFSLQRVKFAETLIDVVTLIRFIVWAFVVGCCFICFALPLQRCYLIFEKKIVKYRLKNKQKKKTVKNTEGETTRINVYNQIQEENPYDDLRGKIQEIVHEEAEGI